MESHRRVSVDTTSCLRLFLLSLAITVPYVNGQLDYYQAALERSTHGLDIRKLLQQPANMSMPAQPCAGKTYLPLNVIVELEEVKVTLPNTDAKEWALTLNGTDILAHGTLSDDTTPVTNGDIVNVIMQKYNPSANTNLGGFQAPNASTTTTSSTPTTTLSPLDYSIAIQMKIREAQGGTGVVLHIFSNESRIAEYTDVVCPATLYRPPTRAQCQITKEPVQKQLTKDMPTLKLACTACDVQPNMICESSMGTTPAYIHNNHSNSCGGTGEESICYTLLDLAKIKNITVSMKMTASVTDSIETTRMLPLGTPKPIVPDSCRIIEDYKPSKENAEVKEIRCTCTMIEPFYLSGEPQWFIKDKKLMGTMNAEKTTNTITLRSFYNQSSTYTCRIESPIHKLKPKFFKVEEESVHITQMLRKNVELPKSSCPLRMIMGEVHLCECRLKFPKGLSNAAQMDMRERYRPVWLMNGRVMEDQDQQRPGTAKMHLYIRDGYTPTFECARQVKRNREWAEKPLFDLERTRFSVEKKEMYMIKEAREFADGLRVMRLVVPIFIAVYTVGVMIYGMNADRLRKKSIMNELRMKKVLA